MMRKLVVRFLMLLFVLGMSTNAAWANSAILESLDGDTRTALFTPLYSAQLTGHVSSTGGGKVYVSSTDGEPTAEQFDETSTDLAGMAVSMQGMEVMQVPFWAWQKADDGYCFAGWSFADKGTDLGLGDETYHRYIDRYDVSKEMAEVTKENGQITGITELKPLLYDIYATFEPIYIVGYEISGSNTITEGTSCTQTVTFTLRGEGIDAADFYAPAITSSTGGGSWTNASGATLSVSDLSISGTTATVTVKFTAPNENVAEYTANLQLKTQANITMNVLLGARIIADGVEAIRLNKSKVQYEGEDGSGTLENMLDKAVANDIIKLNGNYSNAVSINKSITFDFNGYTLSNTLTIGDGNVTIAYSQYGGLATALNVTGGKVILNGCTFGSLTVGANGTVEQNGATITGATTNNGALTTIDGKFQGGLTSAGTLTVNGGTFDGDIAINVTSGTAQIKKGTIAGTTYGVQTNGGSATIEKLAVISGDTKALNGASGTLTINSGKFTDPSNLSTGSINFNAGYFQTNNSEETQVLGKPIWRNTSGAEFREGYEFFVGSAESARAAGVSVCHIGSTSYAGLEEALAYANNTNNQVVIIMDNDYTLPAGFYTLPDNATLIIPMSNEQGDEYKTIERVVSTDNIRSEDETAVWVKPTKFRKLTLANGVNWDVHGTIEVSCSQYSTDERFTGTPYGPYGQLQLNPGSKMILQDGAELRAWGYVTGDIEHMVNDSVLSGEIDARRGSMVREQFQMGDWKGAYFSGMGLLEGNTVFPLTTYFIQNVEVPVKYHPGAALSATTGVSAYVIFNISMSANDVQIIGKDGDVAMFLMNEQADAENTWVRKFYDAKHDQQVYEINSGAHIGSMVIPLISYPYLGSVVGMLKPAYADRIPNDLTMNSGQYNLPITNNFKLHLLTGEMDFTQSTELLPGSEVEVDKEGIVFVSPDDGKTAEDADNVNGGFLYVYDASEWGNYAGGAPARLVKYSPVFDGEPTTRGIRMEDLKDATINVHGTFDTRGGYVLTSVSGANIFSSVEDAGTFLFSETGAYDGESISIGQVTGATGGTQVDTEFSTLKLKNSAKYAAIEGNDEYINTVGTEDGTSYCYLDIDDNGGRWMNLEQSGCFTYDVASNTYFIKPQEYVAVTSNVADPTTHTYSDAAGAGRLFILLTEDGFDCHWWEVEAKDNYYHCIHPENDTYYYWNLQHKEIVDQYGHGTGEYEPGWDEVKFTITWKDWNGSTITTYSVPYGTQAEWLSSNPTREKTVDYTYDFTGWSPALGKVTSDVTYTATYEEKQIKYTIVFVQDGGVEIERHLLARNEMPVCENLPTRTGYILEWSPAIAAVTGNQTYTATWLPEPPTEYEITFYNYDGSTILKQGDVNVGDMPVPPAQVTGKPATSEYTYVFDHWSPAVEKVSTTSIKSYTAVYREEARTYTISYYKEDGTTLNTSEQLPYGATPTPPAVTKENPATGHTYTLVWKTLDGTGGIQTVMGDASYKPTYLDALNKYTVTVKSNPSGACSITGAGLYDYNTSATITLTVNDGYTFTGWSDGQEGTNTTRTITVTEDKELVANFTVANPDVTIIWKNEAGTQTLAEVGQKSGTATIYTGVTPAKASTDQYSYTFYGWTTAVNEGGTKYKNGMTPKATANATYFACFTPVVRQYNVALSSNIENVCILVGAGTYDYSASNNATVIVSGYDAVNYTFDGWYNGEEQVSTAESYSFAVHNDVNLVAKFSPVTYTITWKSEDGVSTLETDADQAYGAATAFNSAEPSKSGYSFIGWTTAANGEGSFYAKGATPAVSGNAIYYAYFAANSTSLEIGATGSETLTEATDYTTFTITSNGVSSGQLIGANNLSLLGEAVFKLQPAGSVPGRTWYAVAAPWQVDVRTGIYANGNHLNVGVDFDIIEFNAESYAVNEAGTGNTNIWRYVEENSGVMQPGKLYLIYLASAKSSLEFHKTGGGISTTTLSLTTTSVGSDDTKANWNAIANPALYHADLGISVIADEEEDVLQFTNGGYTPTTASNMIVGAPIFVQVNNPQSTVNANVHGVAPAPYRRAPQAQTADNRFVVEIARNGQMNDRLIVQTADEKENTYVIGQDLAKMGVGTKTAQMWMNRYNTKLCKNTVEMDNNNAEYPLSIYAPAAGEYTLSAMQKRGDADLYLTLNGETIWNLSDADYTLNLNKGTAANYGLRISVKKTPTGIDEAVVDAKGEIRKVLINDKVFIIRGDKVYTIDGQMVK